jgi:hypothetical protein
MIIYAVFCILYIIFEEQLTVKSRLKIIELNEKSIFQENSCEFEDSRNWGSSAAQSAAYGLHYSSVIVFINFALFSSNLMLKLLQTLQIFF